jgi:hypothetical protein
MFKKLHRIPLLQQCAPEMTPGYAGCLVPRKTATDRQTGMNRPIRCPSLMPEREENLSVSLSVRVGWEQKATHAP